MMAAAKSMVEAPTSAAAPRISAIVPTIGRPQSLTRLLVSLARQTRRIDEVIVADGSGASATAVVTADTRWAEAGLNVRRIAVAPPHAVRQRQAAIAVATGNLLLLLDDDVETESDCVAQLLAALASNPGAVAAMADFNNQAWPAPTRAWRLYLGLFHQIRRTQWQGRVLGPLLRFGFDPPPTEPQRCDWLGVGNSLVQRAAFDAAGGFSDFFLHRSTMNEDVDLGIRLSRIGPILFCPRARLAHFHDPAGRVAPRQGAEDDVFNRFFVLYRTAGHTRWRALGLVAAFVIVESASNAAGALRRLQWRDTGRLIAGRFSGLRQAVAASRRSA